MTPSNHGNEGREVPGYNSYLLQKADLRLSLGRRLPDQTHHMKKKKYLVLKEVNNCTISLIYLFQYQDTLYL